MMFCFALSLNNEFIPIKANQIWQIGSVSVLDKMMPTSRRFFLDELSKPDSKFTYSTEFNNNMYDKPVLVVYSLRSHLLLIIDQFFSSGVNERSRVCIFAIDKETNLYTGYGRHVKIIDALKSLSPYGVYDSFIEYLESHSGNSNAKQTVDAFYKDSMAQIDPSDTGSCTLALIK